mgnify:CR=1 FL=1
MQRSVSLRVHTLLVVVYALVLSSQAPSSEAHAQPRPVEGVLSIKLRPAASAVVASFRGDAPAATGLAALDGLNRQLGVVRMQRLFRPAGRHEARHVAWGLDRWYRIELPPGADAQAATRAYDRLPEVEVAERQYEKRLWGEFVRLARPGEVYESARAQADDPRWSNSFDLLFRGLELTTGGQRLHRYSDYRAALAASGQSEEPYEGYLQAFRHGMPPHGGFAIGLERWVARLTGAENIRAARLFPRDLHRLSP